MAVSTGQQSTESVARTLYIGVGAVKVLTLNPNKKELEKLYDRELEKEPEYIGKTIVDEKEYANVRLSFVIKTEADKNNGIDYITNHTFFLQKRYRTNRAGDKYQIIDRFGRTAWATRDEIEAHATELTKNDGSKYQASIDPDYRPAYVGEADLTDFLKNLLNIPNIQVYTNGVWVKNPKVKDEDCLARLDHVEDYFKGNFKELHEYLSYQPDNLVKVGFGVRTTDDGRQFQTTYTGRSFKNAVTNYAKLEVDVNKAKELGSLADTVFEATELHEYVVDPTTVNPTLAQAAAAAQLGEESPW